MNKIHVRGNLPFVLAMQNLNLFLLCVQCLHFIISVEEQKLLPLKGLSMLDTHIPSHSCKQRITSWPRLWQSSTTISDSDTSTLSADGGGCKVRAQKWHVVEAVVKLRCWHQRGSSTGVDWCSAMVSSLHQFWYGIWSFVPRNIFPYIVF